MHLGIQGMKWIGFIHGKILILTVRSSISSDLFIDVEFGIAQLSKLSEFLSPGSLFSIDDFEVSL